MSGSESSVVVVTGASGGIGKAACRRFAREGWTVVGTSRDTSSMEPVDGVDLRDLDVTDAGSVTAFVDGVLEAYGHVDVLVNNAGIGVIGAAEDTEVELLERVMDVNLTGIARLCRALLGPMRQRGSGRVVNISSAVGYLPAPFMAAYSASKFALEGWSMSVDHEMREHGVRVVLVEPGYTDTGFDDAVLRPSSPSGDYTDRVGGLEEVLTKALRSGDSPELVADVIWKAATGPVRSVQFPAGALAKAGAVGSRLVPRMALDLGIRKVMRLPLRTPAG